ncbi:hypothetical protein B0H13DRAFT_2672802 [Mycena leptocephala]|nr:hypothetical protein B0H13DRAFT_2672802 [Mycena leptocephala]
MAPEFFHNTLSLYSIPAVWLTAFIPVMLKTSTIQKVKGFNNVQPRSNTARVTGDTKIPPDIAGRIERMEGAHFNGNENFPIWVAAVLAGNFAGLDNYTMNVVSIAYICGRMLYNYIYINQSTRAQSSLRYVPGIMTIHLVPTNSQVLRLECLPIALLIGTWVNSVLYTVEIIQAAYYYRHFKNDTWVLKSLVTTVCAIDTLSMIGNYACVYLYTITHAGANQYWPVPLYLFTTGVVSALVQIFLVARYWKFTKNMFITMIFSVFITVAIGGAFACGVTIATYPAFKDRGQVKLPATTWLVSEAVTDISIAVALLWEFQKVKPVFEDTKSVLMRLVARTIQTGAAGATIAFAALIAYLLNNESNVPVGIAYCLGRVYILTMLANLNIRKLGRSGSTGPSMGTSSTGMRETPERAATARNEGEDEGSGIYMRQRALSMQVHIDNRQDLSQGVFKSDPEQIQTQYRPTVQVQMTVDDSASIISSKKHDLFLARPLNRPRRVTVCL